ncbi:hypothetical protein AEA09_12535 [Lysinibacillus contaminans]|uniref:AB hydrolase-1 domain-containing protein n=1 Tax=Lysinibacillus contaminans TaxID=1293441 RepID=A0ABR5K2Z6_9BACI|nr:alpha/beta hydrolase [Lysinibacillus contaminans]KOS69303.1 hypothetical protein AEA09_12535 [Lysinibacillus contaminans]
MIKTGLFSFLVIILVLIVSLFGYRFFAQEKIKNASAAQIKNGGISELKEILVNGDKQFILVDGKDKTKPFCLFLHGGPGSPFPYGVSARSLYPEITESCVAVYYDQRGSGKSFNKELNIKTMNIDQFIADANVIVDYIRKHYKQEKIYLLGQSFGTVTGTLLVSKYPEKFHAYLGISQLTSTVKGQEIGYTWLENEATEKDDKKTLQTLQDLGEGPYLDEKEDIFSGLIDQYRGMNYYDEDVEKVNLFNLVKGAFISPDYSLPDIYHSFITGPKLSLIESKELKEEIILTDFFHTIKKIDVPIYFIQGKYDKQTNYDLAKQYYELLDAPNGKEFITLENSAHYPNTLDSEIIIRTIKEMVVKEN